jgi:hypothetical protein
VASAAPPVDADAPLASDSDNPAAPNTGKVLLRRFRFEAWLARAISGSPILSIGFSLSRWNENTLRSVCDARKRVSESQFRDYVISLINMNKRRRQPAQGTPAAFGSRAVGHQCSQRMSASPAIVGHPLLRSARQLGARSGHRTPLKTAAKLLPSVRRQRRTDRAGKLRRGGLCGATPWERIERTPLK